MTDPLSIIAGVVGIGGAALQASTAVLDLVRTIKGAPREIQIILSDLNDFSGVVSNLNATLQDSSIQNVVYTDTGLYGVVGSVRPPLATCCTVMTQLKSKIERNLKPGKEKGKQRISSATWYWRKTEVVECVTQLQSNKLNLNIALSSIVSYCTMRSFANNPNVLKLPTRRRSTDTDAASALQQYAMSMTGESSSVLGREDVFASDEAERDLNRTANQRDELLKAARINDASVVKILIEQGADLGAKDGDGWTALHVAAAKGHENIIQLLISQGADVNVQSDDGWTALHEVIDSHENQEAKRLIENGADVLSREGDGQTVLHYASRKGPLELVRLLVEAGADLEATSGPEEGTPLMQACQKGQLDVATFLISKGAKIDTHNPFGEQATHLAAKSDDPALLRFVLDAGGDIEAKDEDGETPLTVAARCGNVHSMEFLLENGANTSAKTLDGRDFLQRCKENWGKGDKATAWIERWLKEHPERPASDKAKSISLKDTAASPTGSEVE